MKLATLPPRPLLPKAKLDHLRVAAKQTVRWMRRPRIASPEEGIRGLYNYTLVRVV